MKKESLPNNTDASQEAAQTPTLKLEMEDVGSLEQVLRGYYLSQLKKIDSRKGRKRARMLLENHLVLPKSRQRTSKDAAYINEKVEVDAATLNQLEQFRLIRRLHKTGANPIYEISHDTLVEPILAERSKREAISRFFKKYGKYFLLLLLLLFCLGALFENQFDILDDSFAFRSSQSEETVKLKASNGIYARRGTHTQTITVPFGDINAYRKSDSLTLMVDVDVTSMPESQLAEGSDTFKLELGLVEIPISPAALSALIKAKKDTAIPMQAIVPLGDGDNPLMAAITGSAVLRLSGEQMASRGIDPAYSRRTRGDGNMLLADFGKRTIQPLQSAQRIKLDTVLALGDLVKDDQIAYDLLKDKRLRLTYEVNVGPTPEVAPETIIEHLRVSGIELQYPDGTKRLIGGEASANARTAAPVTHTVKPGETLYKISKLYNVSTAVLRQLNNLPDNNIRVGQVLRIK